MGGKPCCGRFMRSLRADPALASAARAACGGIIGATPTLLSTTPRLSSSAHAACGARAAPATASDYLHVQHKLYRFRRPRKNLIHETRRPRHDLELVFPGRSC